MANSFGSFPLVVSSYIVDRVWRTTGSNALPEFFTINSILIFNIWLHVARSNNTVLVTNIDKTIRQVSRSLLLARNAPLTSLSPAHRTFQLILWIVWPSQICETKNSREQQMKFSIFEIHQLYFSKMSNLNVYLIFVRIQYIQYHETKQL